MAQIIKQPDGLYCGFSSICDDVIWYNATKEDIIELRVKEARERIEGEVTRIIDKLEQGKKAYAQWTLTYDQMIEEVKFHQGKKQALKIDKLIRHSNENDNNTNNPTN